MYYKLLIVSEIVQLPIAKAKLQGGWNESKEEKTLESWWDVTEDGFAHVQVRKTSG